MASDSNNRDRDLVARRKALENAIRKHDRLLINWLTQKFGDAETAEDIAQNAYLRVWRYVDDNIIDNPRALIFRTAANLAANEFRARRRTPVIPVPQGSAVEIVVEMVASDSPSPERCAEAKQELQASMRAISGLPKRTRRAFILSRFMGKSYKEIAIDLKVSESSVEKYIIAALKALREAVRSDDADANVIDISEKLAASKE